MSNAFITTIRNGTAWSTVGTIALKLIGLATVFLVLHKLTVYEYGLVELALAGVAMFNIFVLPGLSSTIIADIGVEKGKGNLGRAHTIFKQFFSIQMILCSIAFLAVFFGAHLLTQYYNNADITGLFRIVAFTFLISPLRTCISVLYRVYLNFFAQSLYTTIEELIRLVCVLIFLYAFDLRIQGVVLSMVTAQYAVVLVMLPSFMKLYKMLSVSPEVSQTSCWSLLRHHAKWGIFSTYLNSLTQNVRVFFIKIFLGTEVVALYALASGLLAHTISLLPLGAIVTPVIPQYVDQKEKFYRLIDKTLKYQVLSSLLLVLIAYAAFPSIIGHLFPKYIASMPLFEAMLPALILLGIAGIFTPIFYAIKAQRNLFFSNTIKLASVVIILPVSIHFLGLYGIAFEYVLSPLIFVIERYRVLKKNLPDFRMHIRDYVTKDADDDLIIKSALRYVGLFKKS